jgi:acetylornithine deacetylase/succinyl-diaminopimelate desuccinylase-like protein
VDDVVGLARSLIAAGSENPPGDEREVMRLAQRELAERRIDEVRLHAVAPKRMNLVARIKGRGAGPVLALSGHLDTKPVGLLSAWRHDPFGGVVDDGLLYGLGAADMKGAVAAMIVALGRLQAAGGPPGGDVLLVLTADEEAGSVYGAQHLAQLGAVEADAMVIGEASGVETEWECIGLACRGALLFRVEVDGPGGHSSLGDRGGPDSALRVAVRIAERLDAAFRELPGCAVNVPAWIEGGEGIGYGVTAARGALRGDVRLAPGVRLADAESILRRVVAESVDDALRAEILIDELGHPGFESVGVDESSPVAAACADACRLALGREVPFGVFPGGTDAYFFDGMAAIPTVSALGPGRLAEAHRPNEYVSVRGLGEAVDLYEALVSRFAETA